MRTLTSALFGLSALVAAPTAHADGTTDPLHPNIIVIVGDDIGPDKVSSYGGDYPTYAPTARPTTTAIDKLAKNGLRFTRAWATPLCSSTRAALETGLQPHRNGIGTALDDTPPPAGLDPALFTTLAGSMGGTYATGKFGKHHIGTRNRAGVNGYPTTPTFTSPPHPARMGWQRYFGNLDGYLGTSAGEGYDNWKRISWLDSGSGYYGYETTHATDRTEQVALDWINSRTKPFLALITFNAAHSGTTASSSWTYDDVDPTQYRTASLSCLATRNCLVGETLASYQGLVEHMDLQIEALLAGMNAATLDNTIIFFFGDNGTPHVVEESAFMQTGRGKGTTYENGVRVPLIVADGKAYRTVGAGPTIASPGRTVTASVNTLDTYNTIQNVGRHLSVAGVDSMPFTDCFTKTDAACGWTTNRYGYTETFTANCSAAGNPCKAAINWGTDALVTEYNGTCMTHEYYDLSTDPLETTLKTWTGIRATRLQDYFTTLHTGIVDWANPTGGAVRAFCP